MPDGQYPHQTLKDLASKAIQEQNRTIAVYPTNIGTVRSVGLYADDDGRIGVARLPLRVAERFGWHQHAYEAETLLCYDGEAEVEGEGKQSVRLIPGIPYLVEPGLSHSVVGIRAGMDGENCWLLAVAIPRPEDWPDGPDSTEEAGG